MHSPHQPTADGPQMSRRDADARSLLLDLGKTTSQLSKLARRNKQQCEMLAEHVTQTIDAVIEPASHAMDITELSDIFNPLIEVVNEVVVFLQQQSEINAITALVKNSGTERDLRRLNIKLSSMRQTVQMSVLTLLRSRQKRMVADRWSNYDNEPAPSTVHGSKLSSVSLPNKPQIFFGREEEAEIMVQALISGSSAHLAILGPGGMGKTSLATALLHDGRVERKFHVNRIFISCEEVDSADGIVLLIARVLNITERDMVRTSVLRSLTGLRLSTLLVLDNLESAWDTEERAAVERFLSELANIGHLSLVVTLRGAIRPSGVDWTLTAMSPLQSLSLEAARQIFVTISRQTARSAELDTLLGLMDGLPLAITLMAHQGQLLSVKQLSEDYQKERTRLLKRGRSRRLTSLEVSIEVSLNSLTMKENPKALTLLSIICLLPGGAEIAKLVPALHSLRSVRQAAQTLLEVALATSHGNRVRVLAPIRDYVLQQYQPDGSSLRELRILYMTLALQAENLGTDKSRHAVGVLAAEIGNVNSVLLHFWKAPPAEDDIRNLHAATQNVAMFSYATSNGDCSVLLREAKSTLEAIGLRGEAAQCTHSICDLLCLQSRDEEAIPILEQIKTVFESIGDRLSAAQCTQSVGEALKMMHHDEEAMSKLEEARDSFASMNESLGAAQCMKSIGNVLHMQQEYEGAIIQLERAKVAFNSIGHCMGSAQCERSIGDVLCSQDRHEEAIIVLQEAKDAFSTMDHRFGMAQCTQSIGDVERMRGNGDQAIATLQEAKTAFEAMGHRLGATQCTHSIGDILRTQNRYEQALSSLREAKEAYDLIGEQSHAAQCMKAVGDILYMQDEYDAAVVALQEARTAFDAIGDRLGAAECLQSLGDVFHMQDEYEEASSVMEKAKSVYEELGIELKEAECTQSLGQFLHAQDRYQEALALLREAKAAFERLDNPHGVARCKQSIGDLLCNQDEYMEAIPMLEEAKAVLEGEGDQLGAAQCMLSIGKAFHNSGRTTEAVPVLRSAKAAFGQAEDRLGAAQCAHNMGDALRVEERFAEAAAELEEAQLVFDDIGNRLGGAQCLLSRGILLLSEEKYDDVILALNQAKSAFEEIDFRFGIAECYRFLGYTFVCLEREDEAEEMLREAMELLDEIGLGHRKVLCQQVLDDLHAAALP
ncbi:TPR-like protein [Calocera viscosa TUFC12733]|uniref:TPR-like protein n=1 Tax=Calocera viscosa (strain TUFC12733) TaxID=1330018 RepID=A0A167M993_CALVF|nr:TPR-like protein [Calocera viscosa TUFC12733]